jgi:hypothetical protein
VEDDADLAWIVERAGATSGRWGARIQTLWGGYGEIRRVHLDRTSVVVKRVDARGEDDSPGHQRKCRSYDVEMRFYEAYAARCESRTPKMIAAKKGDAQWTFVLEDLDAAGFRGRRARASDAELDRCLAWLAAFHVRFLGVAPEGLWPNGTYWHLATREDELREIDDRALREAAPLLDEKLRSARHRTLVHGDAKLANFCFSSDGVAAVDFQYTGGGTGVQDVAYLLYGEHREHVHLETYLARLPRDVADEWRALYPIAVADFRRFLAGWKKR